jgi:predicted HTH transcriptional regulator
MLRMVGFGENLGSGFPQIIAAWKETNWGEPQLINKIDLNEVELVLPFQQNNSSFRTLNVVKDVVKNCPKDFSKELSDRQRIILKIIKEDNTTTSQKIAQKISQKKPISERTIKSDLAALHEMGILFREGGRKNGYWVIKK